MPRRKKGEETEDIGIENAMPSEEAPSEGLLEAEEARKHKQKRKRGSKSMTIPEVLRFLNGEELLMLMDYLHNNYYLKWFMDVDTTRYTNIFAQLFATYGQQPQVQEQEQPQEQYTQTYTPMYRPSNPLDAMFEAFAGRILDKVLDKVIADPRLQEEIRSIVKASVAGAVQSIAPDLVKQAMEGGAPPPEAPPPTE
jgi:hypothetical protein